MMWLLAVPLLAVVLLLAAAFRGAAIAKVLQDRRYARAKISAMQRWEHIQTEDLLRTAALRTAKQGQELRKQQRNRELNAWNTDFRNLSMGLDTATLTKQGPRTGVYVAAEQGIVGVRWPEAQAWP